MGHGDRHKPSPNCAGAMFCSQHRCRRPPLNTDKELYRIRPRLMRLDATIFLAIQYRPVSTFSLCEIHMLFQLFRFFDSESHSKRSINNSLFFRHPNTCRRSPWSIRNTDIAVASSRICGNEDVAMLEGGIVSWIEVCSWQP